MTQFGQGSTKKINFETESWKEKVSSVFLRPEIVLTSDYYLIY